MRPPCPFSHPFIGSRPPSRAGAFFVASHVWGSATWPNVHVRDAVAAEIGAAWNRTSKGGNSYISVKLDDPSFPAPVYANLIDRNGKPTLIWAR